MRNILLALISVFFGSSLFVHGQFYVRKSPTKWMVATNLSFIQNAGLGLKQAFDFENTWNHQLYPSQLVFTKNIKKTWSWEVLASYNVLSNSKIVNCREDNGGYFFALDAQVQYSFAQHDLRRKKLARLEPFLTSGLGIAFRESLSTGFTPTVSLGGGLNLFFTQRLGLQLRGALKYGITDKWWSEEANYSQLNVGLVYRQLPKSKRSKPNAKARHKWTRKKAKFKKPKTYRVL
jgi:hypothetical protein